MIETIFVIIQANAPINNNNNVGVAADAEEDRENHFPHPWKCSRTRRCKACLRGVQGEGYTAARNSMKIQAQQCQHCKEAVCKDHQVLLCKDCSSKFTIRNNDDDDNYDSQ